MNASAKDRPRHDGSRKAPRARVRRARRDPLRDIAEQEALRRDLGQPSEPHDDRLRLKAEEWTTTQVFDALLEAACAVSANLDLPSLVAQILDVAIDAAHAQRGILFLSGGTDELIPMVMRSIDGHEIDQLERISRTVLAESMRGRAVVTADARSDPRFGEAASVRIHEIRAVACLPMMLRERPVGVLYLDAPGERAPFPSYTEEFLRGLASLAAVALENARLHGEAMLESARLRKQVGTLDKFGRLRTVSRPLISLLQKAAMVARSDQPVMILGESGTGKELLAHAIHDAGPRALRPFVAVNCAAVPRDLLESVFFGHEKGAFTGATCRRLGYFREAHTGTLFLDEIGDLAPELQVKLLRVIEDGVVRPLGGEEETRVDVRLIAATSRNLVGAMCDGRFREELYYRLSVFDLPLPPLRERPEDIPVLVEHFLQKHGGIRPPEKRIRFSPEAIAFLQALPWRGNVRALEILVRRALAFCHGTIDAEQARLLSPELPTAPPADPVPALAGMFAAERAIAGGKPAALHETVEKSEREVIIEALRLAKGNRSQAAHLLKMHRNSFRRRMEKYGIESPEGPAAR